MQGQTTTKTKPVEALDAQLRAAGYVPGVPAHIDMRARCIDATAAARMKCGGCGQRGLLASPYKHHTYRSYRVLVVCPKCLTAEEA